TVGEGEVIEAVRDGGLAPGRRLREQGERGEAQLVGLQRQAIPPDGKDIVEVQSPRREEKQRLVEEGEITLELGKRELDLPAALPTDRLAGHRSPEPGQRRAEAAAGQEARDGRQAVRDVRRPPVPHALEEGLAEQLRLLEERYHERIFRA